MVDANVVIANNILNCLKKQNKKQVDIANGIGTTKQTINKMLNGSRMINAVELKKIADILNVQVDELIKMPDITPEDNIVHVCMGKVSSKQAENTLLIADKLSDMIIFHSNIRKNGMRMTEVWGDD